MSTTDRIAVPEDVELAYGFASVPNYFVRKLSSHPYLSWLEGRSTEELLDAFGREDSTAGTRAAIAVALAHRDVALPPDAHEGFHLMWRAGFRPTLVSAFDANTAIVIDRVAA